MEIVCPVQEFRVHDKCRSLPRPLWLLVLISCGLIHYCVFLRVFSHWWFEDDPLLFALVKTVTNPLRLFLDGDVVRGLGNAYVPMQFLSMWFDNALAYRNIFVAQFHHFIVLEVAVILLF